MDLGVGLWRGSAVTSGLGRVQRGTGYGGLTYVGMLIEGVCYCYWISSHGSLV